jgi:putative autotransporter adhesin-like protein
MRLLALPALALLLLVAAGCGGGPRVTETRTVADFSRLDISDNVDVEVVPGDNRDVKVTAGEDVIDHVQTESADGVLHVDIVDRGIVIGPDPFDDVRVQISADALDGVRIEGAGDLKLAGLDADTLEVEIEGSGDVEASGTVGTLTATVQGAGDADLSALQARTATVTVQGAGDAQLNVTDSLTVTVQGAGDVSYTGNPRVSSDVEGSGDLRHED